MGLASTGTVTTSKKRKSEPQAGVTTPAQDADSEQALPPRKKKIKASVEQLKPSQPTAKTAAKEKMDNNAKKRPTGDESDDASVPAHPAKKTKINKTPLRRSGETFDVKRRPLTNFL
jgi:hypothetical protein